MSMYTGVWMPAESRGIRVPGTEVTGNFETPNVDAGNGLIASGKQHLLLRAEPSFQHS